VTVVNTLAKAFPCTNWQFNLSSRLAEMHCCDEPRWYSLHHWSHQVIPILQTKTMAVYRIYSHMSKNFGQFFALKVTHMRVSQFAYWEIADWLMDRRWQHTRSPNGCVKIASVSTRSLFHAFFHDNGRRHVTAVDLLSANNLKGARYVYCSHLSIHPRNRCIEALYRTPRHTTQ